MPTHSQWTVESPVTTQGNGRSDTAIHHASFPESPFYNGELTAANTKALFVELVQSAIVNDGGHTFGEYNRDYVDAPNVAEVETGGGGLPGTAYSPNIASPAVGHDPTTIPASGAEAARRAQGQGSPFPGNSLTSPSQTSTQISSQTTLGSLSFGRSLPNP